MPDSVSTAGRRLVVVGTDATTVGRVVRDLREAGARVAGFVGGGDDDELVVEMATEMLGGLDEVVRV